MKPWAALSSILLFLLLGCDQHRDGRAGTETGPTTTEREKTSPEGAVVEALSLMEQERYADAIKVLEVFGENASPRVASLREEAQREAEALWYLRAACLGTNGRDLETVYQRCRNIPERSKHHDQGCCAGAAERWGRVRLEKAVDRLGAGDAEEGSSLLQSLIDDDRMPAELRERARSMREDEARSPEEREPRRRRAEEEGYQRLLTPWLDEGRRTKKSSNPSPLKLWIQ